MKEIKEPLECGYHEGEECCSSDMVEDDCECCCCREAKEELLDMEFEAKASQGRL